MMFSRRSTAGGLFLTAAACAVLQVLASETIRNPNFPNLVEAVRNGGNITFGSDGTILMAETITVSQNTVIDVQDLFRAHAGDVNWVLNFFLARWILGL